MPLNRKTWKVLQVYVPKAEARKFEQYAKRHAQSLSGMIRRIVNTIVDASAVTK